MTPDALAALHARCFTDAPRPWTAEEFSSLLALPTTLLILLPDGFALGRTAGPETELLTLAVAPEARRRGLGRTLVTNCETAARARGATEAFLEVAETNAPARALYAALGYVEAGCRPGYYRLPNGSRVAALVLRKVLQAPRENA